MGKNVKSDLPVMGNVEPLKKRIKELEKELKRVKEETLDWKEAWESSIRGSDY